MKLTTQHLTSRLAHSRVSLEGAVYNYRHGDKVNDNTDYVLLVNKKLLDLECFIDKRQSDSLLNIKICIIRYPFPTALGKDPHGNFKTKLNNIQLYSLTFVK